MIRVGLVGFGMGSRVFHAPLVSSVEGLEPASNAGPLAPFRLDLDAPFLVEFAGVSPSDFCSAEPFLALFRAAG